MLTTRYDFIGDEEQDQINIQNKYSINPNCEKVICAVKKIFGEKLGPKLLYMNKKFGLNGSDISFSNSSRLHNDEIDRMIRAAQDFPPSFFPMKSNKRFIKFKRGHTLKIYGPEVIANAMIVFFDSWNDLGNNEMMEYTAFHELGHYAAQELGLDDNAEWLSIGGWIDKDGKQTTSKKDKCTSEYGQTNPAEDFAESVAAYRYNPNLFKRISPEKYNYIKEVVFQGLEYTSSDKCNPTNSYQSTLNKLAEKSLTTFSVSEFLKDQENLDKIIRSCKEESVDFIFENNNSNIKSLDKCISNNLKSSIFTNQISQLSPPLRYPDLFVQKMKDYPQEILPGKKFEVEESINQRVRKRLKDEVVEGFYSKYELEILKNHDSDAKSLCENMKTYSEQSLHGIDTLFDDLTLAYNHRTKIKSIFYDTCMNIQNKSFGPMSKDAIAQNIPISKYSQKEFINMNQQLDLWKKRRKIYADSLEDNGLTFKAMYYLEIKEKMKWIDQKISNLESELKQ